MSLRDIPGLEGLGLLTHSNAPLRTHWCLRLLTTLLRWSVFALWLRLVWFAFDTLAEHAAPLLEQAWS